jgi:alkylhydroperoxidase family enzyme
MVGPVPQDVTSGRQAVARLAPGCVAAVDGLEATAWAVLDADLVDLSARVVAAVHGTVPLARPTALGPSPWADREAAEWRAFGDLDDSWRTALAFAERFAVDVSAVDDDDRAALAGALGDRAATYAQVLYVADVITRARTLLDRLFGPSTAAEVAAAVDGPAAGDAWSAIEEIIRVVPGLQGLDAVTTELVRLRGARQHNCRICQSLRSFSAFAEGADDATFAAVDAYATSDLSDAHKAALAFTDAFIWTPGRVEPTVLDDLRAHWSPEQQVELVLDIARNASNKFAVAMAADGTDVTEGYAVYDVKADGSIEYGLARP